MKNNQLNWENVPKDRALCFNAECPLHATCLRFQAGLVAPQGLTVARCVTPQALDGGRCCCFASMEPQVYARGFSTLYRQVLKSDYTDMRRELTAYLSGYRYYYDYMRGRRLLSPAQQQWIRDMMLRYGYTDEVTFDGYEAAFDFPWV